MPDHGFGRCDGHHGMVDFSKSGEVRLLRFMPRSLALALWPKIIPGRRWRSCCGLLLAGKLSARTT